MELAFLLHLYQPVTQNPAVVKRIAEECYLPLIRLIKNKKNFKITLSLPLSLLEFMDNCGYGAWLTDIRNLVESQKIELVGTGAYHALLSKLPETFIEKQIILNEYGLGYYFGRKTGFEGEPSILIKDLNGFFPPEVAINDAVLKVLDSLNYSWTLADEVCLIPANPTSRFGVYTVGDFTTKLVVRNRGLSNLLSFKRDLDPADFIEAFDTSCAIALDGEFFGHHYKQGFVLLNDLIDLLLVRGTAFVTVSDYVKSSKVAHVDTIVESTWGTNDEQVQTGVLYPRWDLNDNELHKHQWNLFAALFSAYHPEDTLKTIEGFENVPIWNTNTLNRLDDKVTVSKLSLELLINKALHSDQFWWATSESVKNYWMVNRAADMFLKIAEGLDDSFFKEIAISEVSKIKSLIQKLDIQDKL